MPLCSSEIQARRGVCQIQDTKQTRKNYSPLLALCYSRHGGECGAGFSCYSARLMSNCVWYISRANQEPVLIPTIVYSSTATTNATTTTTSATTTTNTTTTASTTTTTTTISYHHCNFPYYRYCYLTLVLKGIQHHNNSNNNYYHYTPHPKHYPPAPIPKIPSLTFVLPQCAPPSTHPQPSQVPPHLSPPPPSSLYRHHHSHAQAPLRRQPQPPPPPTPAYYLLANPPWRPPAGRCFVPRVAIVPEGTKPFQNFCCARRPHASCKFGKPPFLQFRSPRMENASRYFGKTGRCSVPPVGFVPEGTKKCRSFYFFPRNRHTLIPFRNTDPETDPPRRRRWWCGGIRGSRFG